MEMNMSWNHVQENWADTRGAMQLEWEKLTDDDLDVIKGRRDQLELLLTKYYHYDPAKAASEVDVWLRQF
jgi:uncharacterized protein YjbJ (UPF0337 family)